MATAPASFLDPALLARISDLALLARTVVDGFMHGQHRSLRKGSSLDFAEHRSYQPGDDLRRIDWRVYGRTDRFYIKEYDADTNAGVIFALDASKFGRKAPSLTAPFGPRINVVTDTPPSPEVTSAIADAGASLTLAAR